MGTTKEISDVRIAQNTTLSATQSATRGLGQKTAKLSLANGQTPFKQQKIARVRWLSFEIYKVQESKLSNFLLKIKVEPIKKTKRKTPNLSFQLSVFLKNND